MKRLIICLLGAVMACFHLTAQAGDSGKALVAYFSATGTTKAVANEIAEAADADLFVIEPEKAYTAADLNWHNRSSRSSVEMNDPSARPAMARSIADAAGYTTVYLGFPIWWDEAPRIINTFIESCPALKGKSVIPFATSGGSSIDNAVRQLKASYPDIKWQDGRLLNHTNKAEIEKWINN